MTPSDENNEALVPESVIAVGGDLPETGEIVDSGPVTITDYISGKSVRATPEELDAVQVFSKRLVEELGYPKEYIQTRPQFRVRSSPSGGKAKSYPIDIAVFSAARKLESDSYMIVECKKRTRKDGEEQLKIYMTMSPAQIGVWFNGHDHLYLLKEYREGGEIHWSSLPSLPKFGQTISDIGTARRRDLVPPTNLKTTLRDIRNHLAGNTTGITRDQELAIEITSILFCKIYDEINSAPDDLPQFRAAYLEPGEQILSRINKLFDAVRDEYPDVFRDNEVLSLDAESLRYIVGELQNYCLIEASRDAIGDAFEVFIGPAVRGEEGQFFTPRNVVQMMIEVVDPKPGQTIIDPACGSGGFLIVALEKVWSILEEEAVAKNWTPQLLERRRKEVASRCFRGTDKDAFLTKITKAYMAIIGDGRGGIFCEDSLADLSSWHPDAAKKIQLNTFDIVVTNPPFGSKIKVTGAQKLGQYDLAKRWKAPKTESDDWSQDGSYRTEQSPQVLFIERCIQLLKPNGKLAIVLPESIFGMPVYGYVVEYLFKNFSLRGFVSLPEEVFQPYTHAKTCVLFLQKRPPKEDESIEMAIADWCGHDSRGNPTLRTTDGSVELLDDIPRIGRHLHEKGIWL
ncbi:N-6 DNA methylase [Sinorhizobium meliloti]|nr:N-6 DNA methylase [Sinorhizobium meliloti]